MYSISSKIDEILSKDRFTLEELLEDEEITIETKNQNKPLLDLYIQDLNFDCLIVILTSLSLSKEETIEKLLGYVLVKAKENDNDHVKIL